jgi:hypothetical protein
MGDEQGDGGRLFRLPRSGVPGGDSPVLGRFGTGPKGAHSASVAPAVAEEDGEQQRKEEVRRPLA